MTVVEFSSLSSMTALDLEEVKAHISRQDASLRLLEDSLSRSEKEKQSVMDRLSQLEILLKGRQGALIAKESECRALRAQLESSVGPARPSLSSVTRIGTFMIEPPEKQTTSSVWLSTSVGVGMTIIPKPQGKYCSVETLGHVEETFACRSPPPTVFRRELVRSPDSPLSPPTRRSLPRPRASRESFGSSFASVRSSRTIRSISDDDSSDESLNELVSNAMRLSAASFRSSTRSLDFPKRWK